MAVKRVMIKSVGRHGLERLELQRLRDRVGRLFAAVAGSHGSRRRRRLPGPGRRRSISVRQRKRSEVRIELPGVTAEQIKIGLNGNKLRIWGEKKKRADATTNHVAPLFGTQLTAILSASCRCAGRSDVKDATAELANGMLLVRLPKIEDRRGAEIASSNYGKGFIETFMSTELDNEAVEVSEAARTRDTISNCRFPNELPVLPLRDIVIYPFMIVPLFVSREKSIRAVDEALGENRMILLASQKDLDKEEPTAEDLYKVGTAAVIMRMLKLPDGRIRILVQGLARAKIESVDTTGEYLRARVSVMQEDAAARALARS